MRLGTGTNGGLLVHGNAHSGSTERQRFLDWLRKFSFLMKDFCHVELDM
jgi:hypothetical protein